MESSPTMNGGQWQNGGQFQNGEQWQNGGQWQADVVIGVDFGMTCTGASSPLTLYSVGNRMAEFSL